MILPEVEKLVRVETTEALNFHCDDRMLVTIQDGREFESHVVRLKWYGMSSIYHLALKRGVGAPEVLSLKRMKGVPRVAQKRRVRKASSKCNSVTGRS
jgi:hypothetical protein